MPDCEHVVLLDITAFGDQRCQYLCPNCGETVEGDPVKEGAAA